MGVPFSKKTPDMNVNSEDDKNNEDTEQEQEQQVVLTNTSNSTNNTNQQNDYNQRPMPSKRSTPTKSFPNHSSINNKKKLNQNQTSAFHQTNTAQKQQEDDLEEITIKIKKKHLINLQKSSKTSHELLKQYKKVQDAENKLQQIKELHTDTLLQSANLAIPSTIQILCSNEMIRVSNAFNSLQNHTNGVLSNCKKELKNNIIKVAEWEVFLAKREFANEFVRNSPCFWKLAMMMSSSINNQNHSSTTNDEYECYDEILKEFADKILSEELSPSNSTMIQQEIPNLMKYFDINYDSKQPPEDFNSTDNHQNNVTTVTPNTSSTKKASDILNSDVSISSFYKSALTACHQYENNTATVAATPTTTAAIPRTINTWKKAKPSTSSHSITSSNSSYANETINSNTNKKSSIVFTEALSNKNLPNANKRQCSTNSTYRHSQDKEKNDDEASLSSQSDILDVGLVKDNCSHKPNRLRTARKSTASEIDKPRRKTAQNANYFDDYCLLNDDDDSVGLQYSSRSSLLASNSTSATTAPSKATQNASPDVSDKQGGTRFQVNEVIECLDSDTESDDQELKKDQIIASTHTATSDNPTLLLDNEAQDGIDNSNQQSSNEPNVVTTLAVKKRKLNECTSETDFYPIQTTWPRLYYLSHKRLAQRLIKKVEALDTDFNFRFPVVDQYPEIAQDYLNCISQPMDFTKIKEKANLDQYTYLSDLQDDFILMFRNCCMYNGENTPHWNYAVKIWKQLNDIFNASCEEENIDMPRR